MDEKDILIESLKEKLTELEQRNARLLEKVKELHMTIVKIEEERFK